MGSDLILVEDVLNHEINDNLQTLDGKNNKDVLGKSKKNSWEMKYRSTA